MEVEHFSHPVHPLILINQVLEYSGELVICSGCDEPIWGPCYSCTSCYFFLHKTCAELPREIKRHIHFKHPLHLLAKPPSHYILGCICDLCKKTCESFVYHCSVCKFDLHIKCAFQQCFFEVDSQAHQFAHIDHSLISNEEQEFHVEGVMCSGCDEPISGPSYRCTSCNFFLHKKCTELPQEIKRCLHPQHPLHLLAKPPAHHTGKWMCDLCNKTCKSFVYRCSFCNFYLDIKCALPPCLSEVEGQEHQFICLPKSLPLKIVSFTCNACGTDGDDSPFVCTMCQLIVHKTCISFPRSIKLRIHQHPRIIHTYHLQQCNSRNKYCGICRDGVDTNYGVYYCQDCDFVAHVNCGIQYRLSNTESDGDERSITMNDEFKESSFDIVREIKHGDERIIAEIKHFSHQHNLILIDEFNNDPKCDGCMLPIFTPFYSCTECNFFLDKACIRLPRKKYWQYDRHPLILILNTWEEDPFQCAICEQYCHGFSYNCDRCHRFLDVRCFKSTKDSIEHGGHEHPLYLAVESENRHCSGCGVSGESQTFRCVVCDFNLGFKCATLPDKARHRYDEHPLFLTYIDPNDYQYVCQICEKERDPKLWFYRCEECDFDAHRECVLGKNPFIKLGGSYTDDTHPHPLTLVEKTDDYPACHTCGEPCDDLALECTHYKCNFIIHYKREKRAML
ncbi:uncharacterized protein LOC133676684 [Populus nigra]|uniref:uncharacterized protein LOC133676684 n=1 Tax=Populus nigra TaxID=3691 RepID=UPI002B2658FA|nr:uncharacterized protein LOC133676684 [Populus nigra]